MANLEQRAKWFRSEIDRLRGRSAAYYAAVASIVVALLSTIGAIAVAAMK